MSELTDYDKAIIKAAEHGQSPVDSSAPIAYIDRKLKKQDALLAEAAEMLKRGIQPMAFQDRVFWNEKVRKWLEAKPLLDKLEK